MRSHYQNEDGGFQIIGSQEVFNRALYGGHSKDDMIERFLTFAGDQPLVMGAVSDWTRDGACSQAKCGTFMAGLALTPGLTLPLFYDRGETDVGGDRVSQWFHEAEGTISTFRDGWMEHEVRPFFQTFPRVQAFIQVLPICTEDGFLVRLRIDTDQQVNLVLAFGGISDLLGSLGLRCVSSRLFNPSDCAGNLITLGPNRATIIGPPWKVQSTMQIGTSFPVKVAVADAQFIARGPGSFLGCGPGQQPIARMSCALKPGQPFDGFVVVLRTSDSDALDAWLSRLDPVTELKAQSLQKSSVLEISTPDPLLDATVAPSVIAQDACWHGNMFYHGTHSWHCPLLGWRTWYGPTVIGWHERVALAVRTHSASQVKGSPESGQVCWDQTFYGHRIKNGTGFIPESPQELVNGTLQPRKNIFYNMQEIFVDHFLHHLEWTRDLVLAREVFAVIADVLDWETHILDPDGNGLYQNWLNTWISDAHAYNGGGCAQSSAYNYRANTVMARLADLLGLDGRKFAERAEKIHRACQERLWLPDRGVMAEYVDTLGNQLVHPSPELATIYHSIESGVVDAFQAYQMLRFTHTDLLNEQTTPRGGRLVWSSNWYPQLYSSCGLYPMENAHLAWAYFTSGLADEGHAILKALVDAHFMGYAPGCVAHGLTGSGFNSGVPDFPDFISLYLRLLVEGLFGVRFDLLQQQITIAPNLPMDWTHAHLRVPDIGIDYSRDGQTETLRIQSDTPAMRMIRLPLRSSTVESVALDGQPIEYRVEPAIGRSVLEVRTDRAGSIELTVTHGKTPVPRLAFRTEVEIGGHLEITAAGGGIVEFKDPSSALKDTACERGCLRTVAAGRPGWHTVFVRCQAESWDGWLTADFRIAEKPMARRQACPAASFVPIDMAGLYNVALSDIHAQKYLEPRPKSYSLMTWGNGRFWTDWNAAGCNKVVVNDAKLRDCGGVFVTESGFRFAVPSTGPNAACASIWENFPEEIVFPLSGRGQELAVFMIGVTNPMQSRVENARLTVQYAAAGEEESVSLVNPVNFDDWLCAAFQAQNETVCFSDHNHGLVQRIALDPDRELQSLRVRAVANEVIVGVLAISRIVNHSSVESDDTVTEFIRAGETC